MPLSSKLPLWQKLATGVILIGLLVVILTTLRTNSGVQATKNQGERRDCITAYNTDLLQVIRDRDNAKTTLDLFEFQYTLDVASGKESRTPSQAVLDHARQLKETVDKFQTEVDHLPLLTHAIRHGYTLRGVHHPPCPEG